MDVKFSSATDDHLMHWNEYKADKQEQQRDTSIRDQEKCSTKGPANWFWTHKYRAHQKPFQVYLATGFEDDGVVRGFFNKKNEMTETFFFRVTARSEIITYFHWVHSAWETDLHLGDLYSK